MQMIDAIVCYLKDNGGVISSARKIVRLSWRVVWQGGLHGLWAQVRITSKARSAQAFQMGREKALRGMLANRQLTILTTRHAMYVAHMLVHAFSIEGVKASIIYERPVSGYGDDVYIVLCPQMFSRLPRAMVAFQMEQSVSERWFTKRYLDILSGALAILDYSRKNIASLIDRGISYRNLFYLPIRIIPGYAAFLAKSGVVLPVSPEKKFDVLFYGDVNNERRRVFLEKLAMHFSLQVVSDVFGEALYQLILQSRVVVNIHYYENALLETTRICETLSLGVPVVSESSVDMDDYPELEPLVRFVNVGDVDGMVMSVAAQLRESRGNSFDHGQSIGLAKKYEGEASFYLGRFLLAFGLVEFGSFAAKDYSLPTFSTGNVCLSLPETPSRRASFLTRHLDQFELFDGLRHAQAWIGCGLSYKYLATRAKLANLSRFTVCEDDVVLDSDGLNALGVVESYLGTVMDDWDIFAGLIAHAHPDLKISRVVSFGGLTFVHLDRMTTTVLNIYNHSVYDVLAGWNEHDERVANNTIDRYLENRGHLRVVTTVPFIAGHSEEENSTLWGFGNGEYANLIRSSEALLREKVSVFLNSAAL